MRNPSNRCEAGRRSRGTLSPLGVVRWSFDQVVAAELISGSPVEVAWPEEVRTWGQLREYLLDPGLPVPVVDRVWVWLVERARSRGANAALECAGVALPMLGGVAARLTARSPRDRADVESAVLTGFLAELPHVDLGRPYVLYRLRWAAYRGGDAWIRQQLVSPKPDAVLDDPRGSGRGWPVAQSVCGHPELVLAEAVSAGVISGEAAELIAATRLESRPLTVVAGERGDSYKRLEQIRRRAEHKLVAWLIERGAERDPARTSAVEASALDSVALSAGPAPRRGRVAARSPVRGRGQDRRRVLKIAPESGVPSCGRTSAAPALPASVEVHRRCL